MATTADGQPKAAILLIVGEPFSEGDKILILEEIVKGFKGWDCDLTGVDINDELAQIANRAQLGEEGPNGERIIRHQSDNVAAEILVNPQSQTVKDSLKAVLTVLTPVKVVIYAGYVFQGSAAWVVQDELFSFATFNQVFKDSNVENALKQMEGSSLLLHTTSPADWTASLKGSDVERLLKVTVNPKEKLDNCHGLLQFSAYINNFVRAVPLGSMLKASDVVGNISFSRPVLYIFPAHQGDSALFGMKGFNMLVNGGYSRRACFWDFVCHLDGIDALLLTHLGPDNLFGIRAALERKSLETLHPSIDFMYMNTGKATNGVKAVANGDAASPDGDLVINLATEGSRLLELSRKLGTTPHPVTRPLSGNLEPVNLYHKVGQGSLDMYVLNPVGDAKEMKEFLTQWGKQAPSFSLSNGVPVPNCASICALLVVRPANPSEKVTRILFPGTAPQHKLVEGLERVKHLEFLKHPTYCASDSAKPKKAAAGGVGNGRAGSATRRVPPPAVSKTSAKAEPPKRLETKSSSNRVSSAPPASAKATKLQKDSSNKRASSAKEKAKQDEKEKEDKSKSSGSSSPSKGSVKTASPVKTPSSPVKTPSSPVKSPSSPVKSTATTSPDEIPPVAALPLGENAPATSPAEPQASPFPEDNHLDQEIMSAGSANLMDQAPVDLQPFQANDNRMADSPEALPEPEQYGAAVNDFGMQEAANLALSEREQLREMGIYDDDDEGVDNGFDDKENGGRFANSGSPEADDEEVQPQSLPEPVATVESPMEPDLIQDTFSKPSAMEQSQIFEDGLESDYSAEPRQESPLAEAPPQEPLQMDADAPAEPEPVDQHEEQEKEAPPTDLASGMSPSPEALTDFGFSEELKEPSPAPEGQSYSDKEPSPELQEQEYSDEREPSPELQNKRHDEDRELSPQMQELGYDNDREPSPELEEPGVPEDVKESSPHLEEPDFADEHEAAESGNAIEQNIQYGVTNDNGFQMGGIREEEEEDEREDTKMREESKRQEGEMVDREEQEQEPDMKKQTMEEMGIYDDEEDKDAYVYEKDVNLEDEEVRMGGGVPRCKEEEALQQQMPEGASEFEAEQDQPTSNIPEAFEKDETPTPVEKQETQVAGEPESAQVDSGREDTDSIDGGTPDDDKDIDEILAMKQQQQQAELQDQADDPHQGQEAGTAEEDPHNFNPFMGLDAQNPAAASAAADGFPPGTESNQFEEDDLDRVVPKGDSAEFDPLSHWGPPTGLPSPAPPQEEKFVEENQEQEMYQKDALQQEQEQPAIRFEDNKEEAKEMDQDHFTDGVNGDGTDVQDLAFQGLGSAAIGSTTDIEGDNKDFGGTAKSSEADPSEFDPLSEWGQPMGLPAPPPPEVDTKTSGAKKLDAKKSAAAPGKSKTATDKRPTSATKSAAKPANGTAEPPKSARSKLEPKKSVLDSSRISARPASSRSLDSSRTEAAKSRTTTTARKAPASATKRASPEVVKMSPLPAFTPFYVDLTYIPNHGDLAYVDAEFFKRVRARYYVLSARNPNPKVLELLIDAKASWDKTAEQEVTVIPTYETPILTHWMAVHKEKLSENKIEIAPSASRCTVRLQDHEDSCYTYRLEF